MSDTPGLSKRSLVVATFCVALMWAYGRASGIPGELSSSNEEPAYRQSIGGPDSYGLEPRGKILTSWQMALRKLHEQPANIVVIGDSIACCIGPRDYGNVWPNVLRRHLGQRYDEHGSGIIPVGNNDGLATNPQWSLHKKSGEISTVDMGPYQSGVGAFSSTFKLRGDAELTLLVPEKRPTQVVLYYASSIDTAGGIQVRTDAGDLMVVGKRVSHSIEAHVVSFFARAKAAGDSIVRGSQRKRE
jgi:hypothetical protein